jgi:hypothetical protein
MEYSGPELGLATRDAHVRTFGLGAPFLSYNFSLLKYFY